MQILPDLRTLRTLAPRSSIADIGPAAVTIGNFDGCHLGHQRLLAKTVEYADELQLLPLALTFSPRPEAFFLGKAIEPLLFSQAQKTRAFAELGIKAQVIQPFDEEFSKLGHNDFYEKYLREALHAKAIVVGDNFRFGHKRGGDAQFLAQRASQDGLRSTIGSACHYHDAAISSTRIRQALCDRGAVSAITAMLGRPYMLEGHIERGDQLGRQLGVPTANLEGTNQLVPAYGIYAGYVWLGPRDNADALPPVMRRPIESIPAVFSIGIRPTIDRSRPPLRIEAHLLRGVYGADQLYGLRAGYYLTHWLRGERQFADLETLKEQMALDIAQAHRLLEDTKTGI